MKLHYATAAIIAGLSVALSSCVAPAAGYVSYSVPVSGGSISAGVAWTNASYDADGFPIFGYSYGRPVYGYTAAGAAIFTIAALTALSYVPHWSPATWYRGHFHYPVGIHRVAIPPHYPMGHAPHMRPPVHAHVAPALPGHVGARPGVVRPGAPAVPPANAHRPGVPAPMPGMNLPKLPANPHVGGAAAGRRSPGHANNGGVKTLPTFHRIGDVPSRSAGLPSRPSGHSFTTIPAHTNRPVISAPTGSMPRIGGGFRSPGGFSGRGGHGGFGRR